MLRNIIVCVAACASLVSCGSSGSSNDQGTSFLALGWYTRDENNEIVPSTSVTALLSADAPILAAEGLAADGKQTTLLIGLENRLSAQFIRVTRVDCSYDVVDSTIPIPGDSVTKSFVLGATDNEGDPFADDENVRPQVFYMTVPVITTDIYAFINVNRASFPELPFTMTVTCEAVGVTQSGDVMVTNPVSLTALMVDTAECCTGATDGVAGGFQNGSGTGGTLDSFDGSGSSSASSTSGSSVTSTTTTTGNA